MGWAIYTTSCGRMNDPESSFGIRISTRFWNINRDREFRVTVFWGAREWNWYFAGWD